MEIVYKMGILKGILDKSFEKYLRSSAEYAYRKAMGGRSGTINEPALKEIIRTPFNGYNYSQQLWGHVDNLAKDLKDALKRGFVRGEHPRVLARDLGKRYKVANHRAETLIRTDGTSVVNRATARRYMDAGLEYYRVLVHMDNRTTEICRKHHAEDKRYRLDEMKVGINAPPFHFNCRSGIILDEEELDSSVDRVDLISPNKSYPSGSISKRRGDVDKQKDMFAERYYNQLRNSNRKSIVDRMAVSSGVDNKTIGTALAHILDNKYKIWDYELFEYRDRHFYPEYDMAQSLQRLYLGNPRKSDIIMLEHEALESLYMNSYKMSYDDAHALANAKYNYEEAVRNGSN